MLVNRFRVAVLFSSALMLAGCVERLSVITWIPLGDEQIPILNEDTAMARAARQVQARWPTLNDAEQDTTPLWRDAHPAFGLAHGELSGFGITMVRVNRRAVAPDPEDIPFATGELSEPNLLFFDRSAASLARNMPIIGMGFGFEFLDADGDGIADVPVLNADASDPQLEWLPAEALVYSLDGTLIHEAGYHLALRPRPGFEIATDDDLEPDAVARGITVDRAGHAPIGHEDLQDALGQHGRIWAVHVWFEPETGLPTISPCDPWHRQRARANNLPEGTFYYRDDTPSRALVAAQCENGGVYPTIAAQAPD
ncbi:MAG: hypothetical protein ACPGSI_06185 [Pikeienuella sp.]